MPGCIVLGKDIGEPTHIQGMLWACRAWRSAALPLYSSTVTVRGRSDTRTLYWGRRGLTSRKASSLGWAHHVQKVVIVASSMGVIDGETLHELRTSCLFANATHAQVQVFGSDHGQVDIGAAMKVMQIVMPRLRGVDLGVRKAWVTGVDGDLVQSADLVACPAPRFSTPTVKLKTLTIDPSGPDPQSCLALARRCSPTLESLTVRYIHIHNCIQLIQDSHERTVEYPNLKHLELDALGAYEDNALAMRLAPAGIPFPSLQHLDCKSAYPFVNDVLLRGCHASLLKLAIAVDMTLAGQLFPPAPSEGQLLAKCLQLRELEIQVITRSGASDNRNRVLHDRVLSLAFAAPLLDRLRICYPNSKAAEYKDRRHR
ncbi:hypothetical protein FBU59_006050 [Linderina macrospora]|uniref:Uncharacterized protein n=1 Tax=Linderina macrospora TaxID=4868 RepID=A0ACC1J130_9FUNG|nr:hypothetical protein FBU59_006050 [Linderina macrospora]